MSALDFVPVSVGLRTATAALNLRTAATIDSKVAYTASTNTANTVGWEYVHFAIVYAKGDETSIRFKAELYDGTNWQPVIFKDTQLTGYSAISLDLLEATASLTGGLPPILVLGYQQARLSFIANGGTPTGTIGITATASVGIAARSA